MENSFKEDIKEAENSLFKALLIGVLIGLVGIVGFSISISGIGNRLLFVALLLAIATFMVGFFTGTLFGMPKRNSENDSYYTLNNSLVEISDWLTKIIVGLGLVNLKQVPTYLMSLGKFVSEASHSTGQSLDVFAMCIVVYFAVLGLYIGYNYMRLVLSQKYKKADDHMLRKELEKKDIQTRAIIDEANKNSVENSGLSTELYVNEMKTIASAKLDAGFAKTPSDPQKSQWGEKSEVNQRKIEAEVKEIVQGFYSIKIRVISTNPSIPLEDGEIVLLALHQTFGTPPFRYVKVVNGVAEVKLISYGSFTVGALVDKGKTELELDLAELPNVSAYFKTH